MSIKKSILYFWMISGVIDMAELTINEYQSRLHILSQKADADGRHKVSEFTLHLLKQENPDLKILDAIFKYYDSITDSDTVVYDYLLDNKAKVEWFYFCLVF